MLWPHEVALSLCRCTLGYGGQRAGGISGAQACMNEGSCGAVTFFSFRSRSPRGLHVVVNKKNKKIFTVRLKPAEQSRTIYQTKHNNIYVDFMNAGSNSCHYGCQHDPRST